LRLLLTTNELVTRLSSHAKITFCKQLASLAVSGRPPMVEVTAGQADRYLVIDAYQRILALV
jgi:hypothetical protein